MKYIYFSITVVLFEYGKLLAAKLIVQSKVRTSAHYDYIKIIDEWFLLGQPPSHAIVYLLSQTIPCHRLIVLEVKNHIQ